IEERLKTNGRVPSSSVVEKQRKSTNGGLLVRLIEKERTNADGGVQTAINVKGERLNSNCRVAAGIAESATIIIQKRINTNGSVCSRISVQVERLSTNCRVVSGRV